VPAAAAFAFARANLRLVLELLRVFPYDPRQIFPLRDFTSPFPIALILGKYIKSHESKVRKSPFFWPKIISDRY
jgi:hypothetical protein